MMMTITMTMMTVTTMMTIIMKMIRMMTLMITIIAASGITKAADNCHDNYHRSILCITKGA